MWIFHNRKLCSLLMSYSEIHRVAVGEILMWHGSALITHSDLQRCKIGRSDGGTPQRVGSTIHGVVTGGIRYIGRAIIEGGVEIGYARIALIDAHSFATHNQLYLSITDPAGLAADHSSLEAQQSASDGSCVPTREQQLSSHVRLAQRCDVVHRNQWLHGARSKTQVPECSRQVPGHFRAHCEL